MSSRPSQFLKTACLRRMVASALVLSMIAGSVGIPIVRSPQKDRAQPFPCQDNPCGCATAEQCWRSCCCHTNREKVAWARQHGVTPPGYVIAAAETESNSGCGRACCARGHQSRDRVESDDPEVATSTEAAKDGKDARRPRDKMELSFISSELARRCQGLPGFLTVLTSLTLPDPPLCWTVDRAVSGQVYDLPLLLHSADRIPPVPPPRLLCAAA